jgi:predicted RNA-binding protein with PIN domain
VLLIDGYNVLHAMLPGAGSRVTHAEALLTLLDRLVHSRYARWPALLVLDGAPGPRSPAQVERIASLLHSKAPRRLEFTGPGRDADSALEAHLQEAAGVRQLLVVSSDARLRLAATQRGAAWMSSPAFLRELDKSDTRRTPASKDAGLSLTVAQWMEYFGLSGPAADPLHDAIRTGAPERVPVSAPPTSGQARSAMRSPPPSPSPADEAAWLAEAVRVWEQYAAKLGVRRGP